MAGMATKLTDLTVGELREALAATEQLVGKDSASARVLRRELRQRERHDAERRQGVRDE